MSLFSWDCSRRQGVIPVSLSSFNIGGGGHLPEGSSFYKAKWFSVYWSSLAGGALPLTSSDGNENFVVFMKVNLSPLALQQNKSSVPHVLV